MKKKTILLIALLLNTSLAWSIIPVDGSIGSGVIPISADIVTPLTAVESTDTGDFDFSSCLSNLNNLATGNLTPDSITQATDNLSAISKNPAILLPITEVQYTDLINALANIERNKWSSQELISLSTDVKSNLPPTYKDFQNQYGKKPTSEDSVDTADNKSEEEKTTGTAVVTAADNQSEEPVILQDILDSINQANSFTEMRPALYNLRGKLENLPDDANSQAVKSEVSAILLAKLNSLNGSNYKTLKAIIDNVEGINSVKDCLEYINQILTDAAKKKPSVESSNKITLAASTGGAVIAHDSHPSENKKERKEFVDVVSEVYTEAGKILNSEEKKTLADALGAVYTAFPDSEAGIKAIDELLNLANNAHTPAGITAILRSLYGLMVEYNVDEGLRRQFGALYPGVKNAVATLEVQAVTSDNPSISRGVTGGSIIDSPEFTTLSLFSKAATLTGKGVSQIVVSPILKDTVRKLYGLKNKGTITQIAKAMGGYVENLDGETRAEVVGSFGKAAGVILSEIARNGDISALSPALKITATISGVLSGNNRKIFTQAFNDAVYNSNNPQLVKYILERYPDGNFGTTDALPQYKGTNGGLPEEHQGIVSGTLGVSGIETEGETGLLPASADSGSSVAVTPDSNYIGLGNESNDVAAGALTPQSAANVQTATVAGLTPGIGYRVPPAVYAGIVAGYMLEHHLLGNNPTVDEVGFAIGTNPEIQALIMQGMQENPGGIGYLLGLIANSSDVALGKMLELSGISLSSYAATLMLENSIANFIHLLYGNLKDASSLKNIDVNGQDYIDFASPQAIIKEILKRLKPDKKTEQRAKLKLVFPERIPLKAFIIIFLSIVIFASVFGVCLALHVSEILKKRGLIVRYE